MFITFLAHSRFFSLPSIICLIVIVGTFSCKSNNPSPSIPILKNTSNVVTVTNNKSSDVSSTTNLSSPSSNLTSTTASETQGSEALKSTVKYSSEDSIKLDATNNTVILYGKARVNYEDFELIADYIKYNKKDNTLFSKGLLDNNLGYKGRPIFKSGKDAPMTCDSLAYNFKTKKGKSFGFVTQQDGGVIHAQIFKKSEGSEGFFRNGIYTTCDAPEPHFGIRITKGIATENKIITGPSLLEIEDIPFPILLPFGFFPKPNKRASGLIIPSPGEDATRGFFLRDGGYYIAFKDYVDLKLTGSAYTKGSYSGALLSNYKKRYKYSGNLNFTLAHTQYGLENTSSFVKQNDFRLTWTHQQNPSARPGTTFGANVNIASSSYLSNTAAGGSYNLSQILNNNLSSSISYGRTWKGKPYNFTTSFSHRQDITKKVVSMSLPNFSFNIASQNPFDSKDRVGEQKWYQRITLGYSLQGQNSISNMPESQVFNNTTLRKLQNGISHSTAPALSLNVLKIFQFNTGMNYTERWYLQSIRKHYDATSQGVKIDTIQGFNRAYDYSFNTGISTKLYGLVQFNKSKIKAIRHVFTPNASFSYRPDFSESSYGFYKSYTDNLGKQQKYSIYEGGVYGSPGAGKSAGINFGFDNTIELKYRTINSSGEEEFKKLAVLQGLRFSGFYNFLADSLKLSPIGFSGRTNLFGEKVGINFSGNLDPYQINTQGTKINKFEYQKGGIARLTGLNFSFGYSFNPNSFKPSQASATTNSSKPTKEQQDELATSFRNPNSFVDYTIPWNLSFNFSFNYTKPTFNATTNSNINVNGDVRITKKWKIGFFTGYDFKYKKITPTSLSIYRDLHCWDLSINWIPFGTYQSYNLVLKVKAAMLSDMKMNKRRDFSTNTW